MALKLRPWVPEICEQRVAAIAAHTQEATSRACVDRLDQLVAQNRDIHDQACFNLNPATNIMNPAAEQLLASGLGSRPSLGYPGDKYEMGLEAIEEIEVMAAALAGEVFQAEYAEIRVPSGAIANLYGFMACARPGDTIIAPPPEIGGHVTHHSAGCAGLYGLKTVPAPVHADGYTVDVPALAALAREIRPAMITVGASLNLWEHPVAELREIADTVGATLLFDAAHQCGMIAGGVWKNPLSEGAHLMTMSTYKSLGGPAGGLIVSNDAEIAQKLDSIAFPGMTANFDAAKSAALARTLLDWRDFGAGYGAEMVATARVFAEVLAAAGIPVFMPGRAQNGAGPERGEASRNRGDARARGDTCARGATASHQFAIEAARFGGGQTASKQLRKAGFLACGIGLPLPEVPGDMNGLRIGTPELVRRGVRADTVAPIAALCARALVADDPAQLAGEVRALRAQYQGYAFIHGA